MRTFKTISAFVGACALIAGLAWVGGFNFDRRGVESAILATLMLSIGIMAALGTWEATS